MERTEEPTHEQSNTLGNPLSTPASSFALVSYLPEPFAEFLDEMRATLEGGTDQSVLHSAHLTLLPPRPLMRSSEDTWKTLRSHLERLEPIELELGEVEMFLETQVIYVSIRAGYEKVIEAHDLLQGAADRECGPYAEPFVYHPHVTLAKGLAPDRVAEARDYARSRWNKFDARHLLAENVHLVTSAGNPRWTNAGNLQLRKLALT